MPAIACIDAHCPARTTSGGSNLLRYLSHAATMCSSASGRCNPESTPSLSGNLSSRVRTVFLISRIPSRDPSDEPFSETRSGFAWMVDGAISISHPALHEHSLAPTPAPASLIIRSTSCRFPLQKGSISEIPSMLIQVFISPDSRRLRDESAARYPFSYSPEKPGESSTWIPAFSPYRDSRVARTSSPVIEGTHEQMTYMSRTFFPMPSIVRIRASSVPRMMSWSVSDVQYRGTWRVVAG